MSDLYNRIEELCKAKNESITTMCRASGVSRASLSDLKMGRNQTLSAETLSKISTHFGVSVDYLLGVQGSEWCARFRDQLSRHLERTNREDLLASGIDVQALWSIADGSSDISFDKACDIADILGVSIDYLLGKEKEKPLVNGDQELTDYLEMLKTRPECRMLFQLTKNATKEDVEAAVRIIEALRNK